MKHVLILEDESLIRQSITYAVIKGGYSVTTTGGLEEAEYISGSGRYDLVIMDLSLRNIANGLQLISGIKRLSPNTKIMVITAHLEDEMQEAVSHHDIDAFHTKPFEMEVLKNSIKRLLR